LRLALSRACELISRSDFHATKRHQCSPVRRHGALARATAIPDRTNEQTDGEKPILAVVNDAWKNSEERPIVTAIGHVEIPPWIFNRFALAMLWTLVDEKITTRQKHGRKSSHRPNKNA
jgi:hypothetical protein